MDPPFSATGSVLEATFAETGFDGTDSFAEGGVVCCTAPFGLEVGLNWVDATLTRPLCVSYKV